MTPTPTIMIASLPRRAGCITLLALAACASGARGGAESTRITPPRILNTINRPELVAPSRGTGEFRVDISVMVDPDGRPDMTSFKLTGNAMSENRNALTDWIARSVFDPAKADGVPVRSEYKTSLKARFSVRRM
ncbi:MAG: hypothetical protein JWN79_1187 [Gemmatimonadetes bacterium]|jgi:hypothetical protein|nr:hypothetical protein [Gemmatimonadota bacterium]